MAIHPKPSRSARDICESLLQNVRLDKIEKSILPSEVIVIDRLLERSLELDEAYEELCSKLHDHPPALNVFFDLLQSCAAFWNPEANLEARNDRAKLLEVNRNIQASAKELATLLNKRDQLKNQSGFSCETFYHPVDVLHAAAEKNYGYQQWVKLELDNISQQYDLKYWPTLSSVICAISNNAAHANVRPHDAATDAGTESSRASLADSFKAFFVTLEESKARNHGFLPNTFDVTDRSMACLMSCALGLGPDEIVDSSYVKRLRQRQREQRRQT